jgi:salicylate hydroxylase
MQPLPSVIIAGAGIGGLVAALSMIERGIDVTIYEQAPELKELGAGVQISANGTRVLIALGLGAAMAATSTAPAGKEVRHYSSGQTWKLFDLGEESISRFGAPYWVVHRGDFHRILLDAVEARRPGCVITGARATGFAQDANGVTLHIAGGRTAHGDVLVAGDGVHSAVRQTMFGVTPAKFLGIAAWRGLVPVDRLPEQLRRPVGTNWVGPGGHVVTYPVRAGTLLNFVGAIERENWAVESWTESGTHEEALADFEGWHEDVRSIVRHMDVPYKWALLGRDPLPHYSEGRVVLLGDAAHPTLPFLAQGAVMAIEDGMVLSRCLEQFADVPTALQHFDAARVERTSAIVRKSSENALRFHNPTLADPKLAAAYIDREWAPDKIASRYDWLFEYDPLTVAL